MTNDTERRCWCGARAGFREDKGFVDCLADRTHDWRGKEMYEMATGKKAAPGQPVPHHEHITVDEETYWSLLYLHQRVQDMVQYGTEEVPSQLVFLSDRAEEMLEQTRAWNAQEPEHTERMRA